jgi:diguanylate cyclase (GGDEF)-like protein/PAS domain S-box-containing protein
MLEGHECLTHSPEFWLKEVVAIEKPKKSLNLNHSLTVEHKDLLSLELLQLLPIPGMLTKVADSQIIAANELFCNIFGLTLDEIATHPSVENCFEPQVWEYLLKGLLVRGFLDNYELSLRKSNGTILYGIISLRIIQFKQEDCIIGTFQDITDKKRIEQPLQESQRNLCTLMRHLPGMAYKCHYDQEFSLNFISEGCLTLTGYHPLEIFDSGKLCYGDWIELPDRSEARQKVQQAIETRQPYQLEYRIITKNGDIKWVWDKGIGIYDQSGKLLYLEGFITDISERKRAEQELSLLQNITQAINEADDFNAALTVTLQKVCETTHWDFGEAWIPNLEQQVLEYSSAWYGEIIDFHEPSKNYTFIKGQGLPGKVWKTRQPLWIEDVSADNEFLRADLAKIYGLRSGLGVPIVAKDQVVAVLVFFIAQIYPCDRRLIELVSTVATQLGGLMERKQANAALKESQRCLSSLINAIPGIFFRGSNNSSWSMTYISEGCQELTGYSSEQLVHCNPVSYSDITNPDDLPEVLQTIKTCIAEKLPYVVEYRIKTKQGEEKWVWEKGHGVFDENGEVLGLEGFISDITELKTIENALRQAEANYRGIFENAIEGIFQTTSNGYYLRANPALARIYGYDNPEELIESLTDIEHQLYVDPQRRQQFRNLLQTYQQVSGFESQIYRRDGTIIWISENARAVKDLEGNLLYYEGTVEDITQKKQTKEELKLRAFYDILTGLPNRALFMDRLNQALDNLIKGRENHQIQDCSQDQRQPKTNQFAVLFLDLDRFKVINDSLGHLIGDQLLVAIARRLEHCVREKDTVARLGGDEFTILLEGVQNLQEVTNIADRIKKELEIPFNLSGHQVFSGASIGVLFSDQVESLTRSAEDLLRDADTALYRAKSLGKGCYQVFDPSMHQKAVALLEIETSLRNALNQGQFKVYYQPIFALENREVIGFEALLRWQHPQKGLIYPSQFMSHLEETDLVIPVGYWILDQICQHLEQWQEKFQNHQFKIHINLSEKQLFHPNLIRKIDRILAKNDLDGKHLYLEISENCWLKSIQDNSYKLLQDLKQRNIGICIDDFGNNYSCLNYLSQFPINGLKLDRSFIQDIDSIPGKAEIARAIFMLANNLNLEAIAAGIETEAQLQKLHSLGCLAGQGYFFSEALNSKKILDFFQVQHKIFVGWALPTISLSSCAKLIS